MAPPRVPRARPTPAPKSSAVGLTVAGAMAVETCPALTRPIGLLAITYSLTTCPCGFRYLTLKIAERLGSLTDPCDERRRDSEITSLHGVLGPHSCEGPLVFPLPRLLFKVLGAGLVILIYKVLIPLRQFLRSNSTRVCKRSSTTPSTCRLRPNAGSCGTSTTAGSCWW